MSNEDLFRRLQQRQLNSLMGGDPMEKHILLLKLTEALEQAPDFGDKPAMVADSPQRQWLARVGALLSRVDSIEKKVNFKTTFGMLSKHWVWGINNIKGQIADAIEELKLDLELDGRSEIGSAYAPGEVYNFYADLKGIIGKAEQEILFIDPYFNGEAFDAYLSTAKPGISILILANKYSNDVLTYAQRHFSQFGTEVDIRKSNALHDRLVIIDRNECWIVGGSFKDAGKKATYLIPVGSEITQAKLQIYGEIWEGATPVL